MSATSAEKIRQAQEARRKAAKKSVARRQARSKPSAPAKSSVQSGTAVAEQNSIAANASNTAPAVAATPVAATVVPAMDTSASKIRQAQEARRKAAQKSAAQRQARRRQVPVKQSVQTGANAGNIAPATQASAIPVLDSSTVVEDAPASEEQVEVLCDLVESNPAALGQDSGSVRQLCRNRRHALSSKGKGAIPGGKRGSTSRSRSGNGLSKLAYLPADANGRDMARLRRQVMAKNGRGGEPKARPSGRVRPQALPAKVEEGTTLSGGAVTGTQVERTETVTGNESGTCRSITGTEYIGSEQFESFCSAKPEPNTPKVGFSITNSGMPVSGTTVGRNTGVTGDEQGSCKSVTGTEYLGSEHFKSFCDTQGEVQRPHKVMSSKTERKEVLVTGSDEARVNKTTGTEAGARLSITGSQYSDIGAAKLTINGPSKVALTHTIAGRSVTGTEVGRSKKVTGDEQGSCHSISGTEYMSNEQFQSICQTSPVPHPAKVGIDASKRGQVITGNMLDRTDKVTGTEPGSCKHLTGSQYGESKLCGGSAPKAHTMHTLSGSAVTGNRVDHGPKLSGDEQGGCLPVTGTEYYGQEQYAEYCKSTPQSTPAKVGVEHTAKGQAVSGTMVSNTQLVTGNESGVDMPLSGTPYNGIVVPEKHGSCCSACAARDLAEKAGLIPASQPCQGETQVQQQPEQVVAQQPVQTVTPQVAAPTQVYYREVPVVQQQVQAPPQDFSVVSPARQASQERVTGSAYGGSERITGPVNIADQLVSGTPEFRYQDDYFVNMANHIPEQQVVATQAVQQVAPVQEATVIAQKITGEGREDGVSITGDNWARGQQVTGTEGRWSQGRNPTLRGEQRAMSTGAHFNKGIERPDVPPAMVTGSSGNSEHGAIITVSGGARG
jgi:hypothetical protein